MFIPWFHTAILATTLAATLSAAGNVFTENLYIQSSGSSIYKPNAACAFKEYVALGDSYPAGINANPSGQLPPCNSTGVGVYGTGAYGYQFYQTIQPGDFTFVACSGDDTEQCASLQVPQIPNSADLVTINIGGNNGDAFSKVVTRCVYIPGQFGCEGALTNAQNIVAGIDTALNTLFGKVKVAAPSAKVVVFGDVQFWPRIDNPDQCQSPSLKRPSAAQKATMNSLVLGMNQKLAQAANTNGFTWVDVDGLFEGHRLCDEGDKNNTYIQWSLKATPGIGDGDEDGVDDPRSELYNKGVFHPFVTGHDQYRMALEKALGC